MRGASWAVGAACAVCAWAGAAGGATVEPCSGPRPMGGSADSVRYVATVGRPVPTALGLNCVPVADAVTAGLVAWGDGSRSSAALEEHVNSEGSTKQVWVTTPHVYERATCTDAETCGTPYHAVVEFTDQATGQSYEADVSYSLVPPSGGSEWIEVHQHGKSVRLSTGACRTESPGSGGGSCEGQRYPRVRLRHRGIASRRPFRLEFNAIGRASVRQRRNGHFVPIGAGSALYQCTDSTCLYELALPDRDRHVSLKRADSILVLLYGNDGVHGIEFVLR